jgi:hypothetical protein
VILLVYSNLDKITVIFEKQSSQEEFVVTEFVGTDTLTKLKEFDHELHSHNEELILVRTQKAPNISHLTYLQGISYLQQNAATFDGELVYLFKTDDNGNSSWTEGIKTTSLQIDYSDLLRQHLDAASLIIVHTHPDGSFAEGQYKLPPSGLDIIGGISLQFNIPRVSDVQLDFVVVESDRLWEYNFRNVRRSTVERKLDEYLTEIVDDLQPIYACELENTGNCSNISQSQRDRAVDRLLRIYKQLGVDVKEKRIANT